MSADVSLPVEGFAPGHKAAQAPGRIYIGQLSQFQVVAGLVPIWGFGTFAAGSTYGSVNFNTTWPFVYSTLTEVIVQSWGGTQTNTTVWQSTLDTPVAVSTSGTLNEPSNADPSSFNANGPPTTSVTDTVVTTTQNYAWTVHTVPVTGTITYTQTLTGLFSVSSWASLTAAAESLMNEQALLPILSAEGNTGSHTYGFRNNGRLVVPVSTAYAAIGYAIFDGLTLGGGPGGAVSICAAAYGIAVNLAYTPITSGWNFDSNNESTTSGWLTNFAPIVNGPTTASIADEVGFEQVTNVGGIICLKSRWLLLGQGTGIYTFGEADTNHQTVYGQIMDFSGAGGTPNLLSVIDPSGFNTANTVSADGVSVANPMSAWPLQLVFLDTDVGVNLSGSPQYGILGFRSAAE